jgi:hypothetical protein
MKMLTLASRAPLACIVRGLAQKNGCLRAQDAAPLVLRASPGPCEAAKRR